MELSTVLQRLEEIELKVAELTNEISAVVRAPKVLVAPEVLKLSELPLHKYYQEKHKKELLVLHHTAGTTVGGAVNHWKAHASNIGCAYIINRNGTIHGIFPADCWAHHIGAGNRGDEQRSIGIELVNVGPLVLRGSQFYWWPNNFTTLYSGSYFNITTQQKLWRGYEYWELYTDEQYDSLNKLIRYLCHLHDIPFRADTNRGICSHAGLRQDKTDVSPAFDWKRIGL
jgi:N-acetyl-anhydromuramyl-L-alanine amidase AmpD